MNDIEKLIQLTTKEHERDKSSARFFWSIFLLDKWIGLLLVLGLGIVLLWSFYAR
jgi:hypothetical protein